jgi:fibronectin type 3 domain-containing protein
MLLLARAKPNQILLRWAPSSPLCWKKANQYGYVLERWTVTRNGKLLPVPEKQMLAGEVMKPRPLADWEGMMDTSNYAVVLAQAIYADTFQVSTANKSASSKFTNLNKEEDLRYGLGLLGADHHYEAARYAALAYTDNDVKRGERYLYRIYTRIPGELMRVDTAGVFVGVDEYEPLPINNTIKADFGDKMVMLNWDYDRYRRTYNAYIIEKSTDSINYVATSNLPFVDLNKGALKSTHSYFTDSLERNGVKYFYRIRGLNAFGETGPPSKSVKGIGLTSLKEAPFFTGSDILSDTAVLLKWLFDPDLESSVSSFELRLGSKAQGPFQSVMTGINPSTRAVVYHHPQKLEGSYYFQLVTLTKPGTKPTTSFPAFVQTIDSIPPSAPQAPKATVNDKGIIKVRWKWGKEKDIQGYKLFRATHAYEEYSAVFSTISKDSGFIDTVQMNMLNDTIYYCLVAIDNRGNNSEYGKVGFAVKPDVIPPASAFFKQYEHTPEGIKLNWDESPSTDVKQYQLKRGNGKDTTHLKLLKKWKPSDSLYTFIDMAVETDRTYTYVLDVYDHTGLRSITRQPLTLQYYRLTDLVKPQVKGLDALYDEAKNEAEVIWDYREKGVEEFNVYRAGPHESLTLWRVLPAETFRIIDAQIVKDVAYQYGVIAKFKDGSQSKLSVIKKTF